MFKRLHELNYQKIIEKYWIYKDKIDDKGDINDIDDNIFNLSDKRNLIAVLANHLEIYLRNTPIHLTNSPVQ